MTAPTNIQRSDALQQPEAMQSDVAKRVALFASMQQIAREVTLPAFRSDMVIDNKLETTGGFDPVTQADRGCEEALRTLIEAHFPEDGIFGEEHGNVRLDAAFIWIIDPIDGTRAFVSGVPLWGTLVGLTHAGEPVAGLGYQPFIDEAFSADLSTALWSKDGHNRALRTNPCALLSAATLMTTSPALFSGSERTAYDALEGSVRSVRYGTDWYAYALVAAGTADIVVESGLSPYDIAALIPIIERAGGALTDWKGNRLTNITRAFSGQVLAVGDPALREPVLALLQSAAR